MRTAQRQVAARREFRGNVKFIATHDFVRKPEESPNPGHGHHEFGNAETYFLVGDALGQGMTALLTATPDEEPPAPLQPTSRTLQQLEGWTLRVDDRLLGDAPDAALGQRALKFLEAKLVEIKAVVPPGKVALLQKVTIVLDLQCGKLGSMQYHPGAEWLKDNGYSEDLVRCVHLPKAADVVTKRNINEQPWVILHELAHAYHDQQLGFDHPEIKAAQEAYKASGRGDATLLYNGKKVKHYALTNPMEFFAEMTEAYFGSNDFYPFNRAELMESEPELFQLLKTIWSDETP